MGYENKLKRSNVQTLKRGTLQRFNNSLGKSIMKKREKTKSSKKLNLVVAWYKPEQWIRLRKISADASQLEETYGEWQIQAEKTLKDFAARGVFPEKVVVDVEDLLAWCKERELPVKGESRSHYAAWLLKEKDKEKE
jgi:hypothetical protein